MLLPATPMKQPLPPLSLPLVLLQCVLTATTGYSDAFKSQKLLNSRSKTSVVVLRRITKHQHQEWSGGGHRTRRPSHDGSQQSRRRAYRRSMGGEPGDMAGELGE